MFIKELYFSFKNNNSDQIQKTIRDYNTLKDENDRVGKIIDIPKNDDSVLPNVKSPMKKCESNLLIDSLTNDTPKKNELREIENGIPSIFKKADFKRLKIIGQFNMGFIVCLHEETNKIVIIDQHAADERFNLETFQKNRKITKQLLLNPISLDKIDHISEEKMSILNYLGFEILNCDCLKLSHIPSDLADLEFTIEGIVYFLYKIDFHEIYENIYEAANNTGQFPTKLREKMAYKACRSSTMIGECLSRSQMELIVHRLSELDYPWVLENFIFRLALTEDQLCKLSKNFD